MILIEHFQDVYPDPDSFSPDRFMKDGKLDPSVRDPTDSVFGYGRRYVNLSFKFRQSLIFCFRICPGKYLAFSSVWLTVSSILATMEISNWVDPKTGEVNIPSGEYTKGFALYTFDTFPRSRLLIMLTPRYPKTFKCLIKPRYKEVEELINSLETV
jgi:hypothetical protein